MSTEQSNKEQTDRRVTKLARDVLAAADTVAPRLLLQIQGILDSCSADPAGEKALKAQLWEFGIYQVLLAILRQDFNKILDGWNTAVKLSSILVSCCVKWKPPEKEEHSYRTGFLLQTAYTCLNVADKLQKKYIKTSMVLEDTRKQLLSYFNDTMDSVIRLCTCYDHLLKPESATFLQMLLTDDVQTSIKVMSTVQFAHRHRQGLFGELDAKIGNQILDELTFKLTAGSSSEIARAATRTLITMCESHPPLVEHLCSRYKGLKLLLQNRQLIQASLATTDSQRLMLLLEMGSFKQAEVASVAQSVRRIQAWWRSHLARKQLSQANQAFARLQRSFRYRKQVEERKRQEAKMQTDLEHMLMVQRRYTVRQLHKRQLCALEILPASEVGKHLANEQHQAALKIQATWKGHRERRGFDARREDIRRLRAAVRIQRMVRRWLEKVRAKKEEPAIWSRPPGLTETRRAELQAKIQDWRQTHTMEPINREKLDQLHNKAQQQLRAHVINVKASRKRQLHCEALLARLETDASLLLDAPRLSDFGNITADYLQRSFTCNSGPVAARARQDHISELKLLEQPWWRKLGDQYQDTKNSADDEENSENWKVF